MAFITRFAPSPTGLLHIGHAASAQRAFGAARDAGGVCLLRIEDIDQTRCKPEFESAIYRDLDWLGFDWPLPARRQSDHFEDYAKALENLIERGLVYRCFKTRKDILADIARAPHFHGQAYNGPMTPMTAREEKNVMESGAPFAWRLSLKAAHHLLGRAYDRLSFNDNGQDVRAAPALLGDVILGRKDAGGRLGTSYHLACCYDDALQGVTDIIRGTDLLESTHIHRLLQALMDWPAPRYHHHPLSVDASGKRYAKRDGAITIAALRETGALPENILAQTSVLG